MSITIFHNPRCRKSRETLELLREEGHNPEIHEYLKVPLSAEEISVLIEKLGISAKELIRKTEQVYKDDYKNKDLTEDQWVQAMVDHPKLIERPIVIQGNKAAIGRPPTNVLEIL